MADNWVLMAQRPGEKPKTRQEAIAYDTGGACCVAIGIGLFLLLILAVTRKPRPKRPRRVEDDEEEDDRRRGDR